MPAPIGNSNALKWTLEKTLELVEDVAEHATDEHVLYLGHALSLLDTSTKQWNRLRDTYADYEDLIERMDAVEQKFEARLVNGNLTGRFKGNTVQFILKNHHGYTSYKKTEPETRQQSQRQQEKPKQPQPPQTEAGQLPEGFDPEKAKTPAEWNARRAYIHNRAIALANVMRWNETNPDKTQMTLDADYISVPGDGPYIRLAEGILLEIG